MVPKPTPLVACPRALGVGVEQRVAVDAYLPRFDATGYPPSFGSVLRVHVSGQAILGVVGQLNGFCFSAWQDFGRKKIDLRRSQVKLVAVIE